jgi:signal transduction protein with GAF and PtsI domain
MAGAGSIESMPRPASATSPPPDSRGSLLDAMLRERAPCLLAVARRLIADEDEARAVVEQAIVIARSMLTQFRAESPGAWLQGLVVGLSVIHAVNDRHTGE